MRIVRDGKWIFDCTDFNSMGFCAWSKLTLVLLNWNTPFVEQEEVSITYIYAYACDAVIDELDQLRSDIADQRLEFSTALRERSELKTHLTQSDMERAGFKDEISHLKAEIKVNKANVEKMKQETKIVR